MYPYVHVYVVYVCMYVCIQIRIYYSIMDAREFEWESQLRFYWKMEPDELIIQQCTGEFGYGYEYMGLNGRLVITPLTDRIYLTLTQVITFSSVSAYAYTYLSCVLVCVCKYVCMCACIQTYRHLSHGVICMYVHKLLTVLLVNVFIISKFAATH